MTLIGLTVGSTYFAQDSIRLRSFEVVDSIPVRMQSSLFLQLDSLDQLSFLGQQNMAQMLSNQSQMSFKNLGPGLLATPTFRGGDANQTQVLWNGLKINSPLLGTVDFTTLPVSQFTSAGVVTGNSSNIYASGGLGGGVLLSQELDYASQSGRLSAYIASFDEQGLYASANVPFAINTKPAAVNVSIDRMQSQNAFVYTNNYNANSQTQMMRNAQFSRNNFSTQFGLYWSEKVKSEVTYWQNLVQRQIPQPINIENSGSQQQIDEVHRVMMNHVYSSDLGFQMRLKSFYEYNSNGFSDTSIALQNTNKYQQAQNQLEFQYNPGKRLQINSLINYTNIWATSGNYNQTIQSNIFAANVFASYQLAAKHLTIEAGYRFEDNIKSSGLLPYGGLSYQPVLAQPVYIVVSASQTTRFPTINELYWNPGGNVNLKPEEGVTYEGGFKLDGNRLQASVLAFYGEYKNRIRWLPNGALFSPVNIDQSETQGVDFNLSSNWNINKWRFRASCNFELIQAVLIDSNGQQSALSYIPDVSGNAALDMRYKAVEFNYSHHYMGQRFITSDESAFLPYYTIGNLRAAYSLKLGQQSKALSVGGGVLNLWDWEYQNIPWRPMPGRSFVFQLEFQI